MPQLRSARRKAQRLMKARKRLEKTGHALSSHAEPSASSNRSDIREWLNVSVAIGALLIGIVSFWTTARISGLEDYLRSEIVRRNTELDSISGQSNRLKVLSEERAERLSSLQTVTDQITANNLIAQSRLLSTQQEISRLGIEVISAKQTISEERDQLLSLNQQAKTQIETIDLFRRQRFSEYAFRRLTFQRFSDLDDIPSGETAYRVLTQWAPGEVDSDLHQYVDEFKRNAQSTCRPLTQFRPEIPRKIEHPDAPRRPGKLSSDGVSYLMTNKEYEKWNADLKDWSKRFDEVSAANRLRFDAQQEANKYIFEAGSNCICKALATSTLPMSKICPGREVTPPSPPQVRRTS